MLSDTLIDAILGRLPRLTVGLVGDLFLDRYLDIDGALDEPSLETGLTALQVTGVRPYPGALGTVLNNLAALGVGRIQPVAIVGDDGEGFELRQALAAMPAMDAQGIVTRPDRRTPTYTKPMYRPPGDEPRELSRLDIQNRTPTPADAEDAVLAHVARLWDGWDALIIVDQVTAPDTGTVTRRVRESLCERATADVKFVLADSRAHPALFTGVSLKPNRREALAGHPAGTHPDAALFALAVRLGRPVFGTDGPDGIRLAEPDGTLTLVPGYPVDGPTDIVGAGDSTSAGIACAVAAGASFRDAAAFGNLVASITVAQLGTTGTATPAQVRARWAECR